MKNALNKALFILSLSLLNPSAFAAGPSRLDFPQGGSISCNDDVVIAQVAAALKEFKSGQDKLCSEREIGCKAQIKIFYKIHPSGLINLSVGVSVDDPYFYGFEPSNPQREIYIQASRGCALHY